MKLLQPHHAEVRHAVSVRVDGAAMEAEVADIPALWHEHAGVRQCKEMARTLR